jgi:hypothetical protein
MANFFRFTFAILILATSQNAIARTAFFGEVIDGCLKEVQGDETGKRNVIVCVCYTLYRKEYSGLGEDYYWVPVNADCKMTRGPGAAVPCKRMSDCPLPWEG